MAQIIIREGVTYCVEDDGTEWEYEPPILLPIPELQPTPEQIKIAQLETQLAQTNADLAAILEILLGI